MEAESTPRCVRYTESKPTWALPSMKGTSVQMNKAIHCRLLILSPLSSQGWLVRGVRVRANSQCANAFRLCGELECSIVDALFGNNVHFELREDAILAFGTGSKFDFG